MVVFVGRKQQGREEGRPATKPNRCVQNSWHLLVSCRELRATRRAVEGAQSFCEEHSNRSTRCRFPGVVGIDILGFTVGTDDSSAHTMPPHHGHRGW